MRPAALDVASLRRTVRPCRSVFWPMSAHPAASIVGCHVCGCGPYGLDPKSIRVDHAACALRDRFYGRGVHRLPRLPLSTPLPRDGARAAGGGARLDRIPERGLFLLRTPAG